MIFATLPKVIAACAGRISLKTLGVYIRAMGGISRFLLLLSLMILVEVSRVGATVWLSYWTNSANQPGGAAHSALWYLGIYGAVSGAQVGSGC